MLSTNNLFFSFFFFFFPFFFRFIGIAIGVWSELFGNISVYSVAETPILYCVSQLGTTSDLLELEGNGNGHRDRIKAYMVLVHLAVTVIMGVPVFVAPCWGIGGSKRREKQFSKDTSNNTQEDMETAVYGKSGVFVFYFTRCSSA